MDKPSTIRPPTPEDFNAPPQSSSDEESVKEDSEFEDARPAKRRKGSDDEEGITMKRMSSSPPRQSKTAASTLASEPSTIPLSSWTSSTKKEEDSDLDEPFSQVRSSQTKKGRTYGGGMKNIHTSDPKGKQKRGPKKTSSLAGRQNTDGFIRRDLGAMLSLAEDKDVRNQTRSSFKRPKVPTESPRSQRAARRSSNSNDAAPDVEPPRSFKAPPRTTLGEFTPIKVTKPFIQPSAASASADRPRSPEASKAFKQPLKLEESTELVTGDMQELIVQVSENRNTLDMRARPSDLSATESSFPSISNDAASSSSLSTPPSSPGIDASETETDFTKPSSRTREAPAAVCPVCKVPVDREFLEEFNDGKRLRSRQQLRFCKAHKARSAKSEWAAKGYPEIDWPHFEQRLRIYHPAIDDILKGKRASFYRNAFEDRINQWKFRTMKQMYDDTASVEAHSLGYYGSRGARAMFENLTSNFASKLRRLATSDKVILNGGVAAYIQAVLAPELAVMLVMDDMRTDEEDARAILRDSMDIGNLLNEEEDDIIDVVEPDKDPLGLASDV